MLNYLNSGATNQNKNTISSATKYTTNSSSTVTNNEVEYRK